MSTVTPAQDLVYTDVKAFVVAQLGLDPAQVVKGYGNRIAMPKGPFVVLTIVNMTRLATNENTWDPTDVAPTATAHKQSVQVVMQVDVYGPAAGDQAAILSTLFRDEVACDAFLNCQPLHADTPVRAPLDNGEDQYEDRWLVALNLQYNPVVSTPQQFADILTADLISVDEAYPP